jgi:hypothetical protein
MRMAINYQPEEWLVSDHAEGVFPPGLWAVAGRLGDEYGAYLGNEQGVESFVPESRIAENIDHLNRQGETMLAAMLANLQPDIAALRTGRQKLVCDLAGKKL